MARHLGYVVETVKADWRHGVDVAAVTAALRADTERKIHAVCVVHNETATGVALPLGRNPCARSTRRGHPALLLVDTISSLASLDFRMDEWGIDAVVGGSQKGLMLPTGISFTGASAKAMEAHAGPARRGTISTGASWPPTPSQLHRHGADVASSTACRVAPPDRGGGAGAGDRAPPPPRRSRARRRARLGRQPTGRSCSAPDPARMSDSVTAVMMPEGHDADALRRTALDRFNVSLGGGLGQLNGQGVPHRPSRRSQRADDARHASRRSSWPSRSTACRMGAAASTPRSRRWPPDPNPAPVRARPAPDQNVARLRHGCQSATVPRSGIGAPIRLSTCC